MSSSIVRLTQPYLLLGAGASPRGGARAVSSLCSSPSLRPNQPYLFGLDDLPRVWARVVITVCQVPLHPVALCYSLGPHELHIGWAYGSWRSCGKLHGVWYYSVLLAWA